MPQAFPSASHAPGNTPKAQKRHRKPQKGGQAWREYRDTAPQRKTPPAAVKMAKRQGRPPPALTRARAFIPRPVVFSTIQDHPKQGRPLQCSALQAQAVSIKADQISSQQGTKAQAIQAKRTAKKGRGERSHPARHVLQGETASGGGSRLPSRQRRRSGEGRGAANRGQDGKMTGILQARGNLVAITAVIVTRLRQNDGQTCRTKGGRWLSAPGRGWFAIPRARI